MKDSFVIVRNAQGQAAFKPIQIRVGTYEIIKQIQADTGASIVDLVDAMARFCAERLEVTDE